MYTLSCTVHAQPLNSCFDFPISFALLLPRALAPVGRLLFCTLGASFLNLLSEKFNMRCKRMRKANKVGPCLHCSGPSDGSLRIGMKNEKNLGKINTNLISLPKKALSSLSRCIGALANTSANTSAIKIDNFRLCDKVLRDSSFFENSFRGIWKGRVSGAPAARASRGRVPQAPSGPPQEEKLRLRSGRRHCAGLPFPPYSPLGKCNSDVKADAPSDRTHS